MPIAQRIEHRSNEARGAGSIPVRHAEVLAIGFRYLATVSLVPGQGRGLLFFPWVSTPTWRGDLVSPSQVTEVRATSSLVLLRSNLVAFLLITCRALLAIMAMFEAIW